MFGKKKLFRNLLEPNQILINPILKIATDMNSTRIRDLSFRVDEFWVEEVKNTKGFEKGWSSMDLDFNTKSIRKEKRKNVTLQSVISFIGKRHKLFAVHVKIVTSSICVNNNYDTLMHQYAYSILRELVGSNAELSRLGFCETILCDIDTSLLKKKRYDGYSVSMSADESGVIVDHGDEVPIENSELTDDEIRADNNNKVVVAFFDKHKDDENKQMYIQAVEDERKD